MSHHVALSECISCVQSWKDQETYGSTGYDGALRVLEALQAGHTPVPVTDRYEVEYINENASVVLFKLVGFLRSNLDLPADATAGVIDTLLQLAHHQGDIMFVTDPALLPTDYEIPEAFQLLFAASGVVADSGTIARSWKGAEGAVYRIRIYSDAARTQLVIGSDSQPMDSGNLGTATSYTFANDITDGSERYGTVSMWPDNTYDDTEREDLTFQYRARDASKGIIPVSTWTRLTLPPADLPYGQYTQGQHNVMMDPATQWFIDGVGDVAVETVGYGRALVARLAPAASGAFGSNVIRSAAYIPALTQRKRIRLAFRMRLRDGFQFGTSAVTQSFLFGFGLRSQAEANETDGQDDNGFSIRWAGKGNGDGTVHPALVVYSDDVAVHHLDYSLNVNEEYQYVIEMLLNTQGSNDGEFRAWIDANEVVSETGQRFQVVGQPNVRGISFTNFYGPGNATKPAATSYLQFHDVAYQIDTAVVPSDPGAYRSLDVTASEASFTAYNSDGQAVTTFTPGEIYTIDVAWVDTNGDYAGTTEVIHMDVDVGSEVFVERIAGTARNLYRYTPPQTNPSAVPVTFTWGRYDDASRTTSQNASVTLTLADRVTDDLANVLDLGGSPVGYGNWTEAKWEEVGNGLDLSYALNRQHLSLVDDGGVRWIRQQHVAASNGSDRVIGSFNLPSLADEIRVRQTIMVAHNYSWGTSSYSGKLGFGVGMGNNTAGGDVNDSGATFRISWDAGGELAVYGYNVYPPSSNPPFGEETPTGFYIQKGVPFTVEYRVRMNSTFAANDGEFTVWVNDTQVIHLTGLGWYRTSFDGESKPKINRLLYSQFHGGADSNWSPTETTWAQTSAISYETY